MPKERPSASQEPGRRYRRSADRSPGDRHPVDPLTQVDPFFERVFGERVHLPSADPFIDADDLPTRTKPLGELSEKEQAFLKQRRSAQPAHQPTPTRRWTKKS